MHGSTVVLVAFLTAAATAAATVYVNDRYGVLRPKVQEAGIVVPDLHGMSENDARSAANVAHVALFVASREVSLDAKPGTVTRQSIPAGQKVLHEPIVSVVLAEEVPKVPSVVSLAVADATKRLEQKGYAMQVGGTVADADVVQGFIVSQLPAAESVPPKWGAVTVQVSSGAGDLEVPKLLGLGLTQAQTNLQKLGLKPVVNWVGGAEIPNYVVLAQKPLPGVKVKPGSEVVLNVCRP
jgi:eukaryotic-like serine/threonine-protein kinase